MVKYYDNTMLSNFRTCPRSFFFRHYRHFVRKGIALPLVVGLGWHDSMDVVWSRAKDKISNSELADLGYNAFIERWCSEGLPHPDDLTLDQQDALSPRHPGNIREMLHAYVTIRRPFLKKIELIAVEEPFLVRLFEEDEKPLYCGKRDKIFFFNNVFYVAEHKTTTLYSKTQGFQNRFTDSFSPNTQVDGYIYSTALELADSGYKFGGVWVDAALVHKTVRRFMFIPIDKALSRVEDWLVETREWVNLVEKSCERFGTAKSRLEMLGCFPKNTESCYKYSGKCPYSDLCSFSKDPILLEEPPEGFKHEIWNPIEHLNIKEDRRPINA